MEVKEKATRKWSTFGKSIPLPFLCALITSTSRASSSTKDAFFVTLYRYGMHLPKKKNIFHACNRKKMWTSRGPWWCNLDAPACLIWSNPILSYITWHKIKPPNLFLVKVDSKNLDKVIIKNTHISFINGKNLWSTTVGYVYVCMYLQTKFKKGKATIIMAAPSFYLPSSPNFPFNGLVTLQSFTHTYARNHQKK